MPELNLAKVVIFATGGTIAGKAITNSQQGEYVAAQITINHLLANVEGLPTTRLEYEQLAQIDSKDMEFSVWLKLAQRCQAALDRPDIGAIVITHGTDTIEETAYFLQLVLAPKKPIVFTCAMRAATALAPDGPQNIRDAVTLALTPNAKGVLVVCAGVVHSAYDVQKAHTYQLNAFDSGDAGALGYVEGSEFRQVRAWPCEDLPYLLLSNPKVGKNSFTPQALLHALATTKNRPRVEIVTSHAGATGAVVEALLATSTAFDSPLAGLVVAGTGNGTVHWQLEEALLKAQQAGVAVVRSSRCSRGFIKPGSHDLFATAHSLSPVKARIALKLSLLLSPVSTQPSAFIND